MDNPLCLNDWWAASSTPRGGIRKMPAQYQIEPETCAKCGVIGRLYRHGYKMIDYVDAPSFGAQTVILARVHRYRCRDCNQTFMQPLPDMDMRRRMTRRCVEWIADQGIPRTYAEIARDVGVDEKTVRSICNEQFASRMARYRPEAPVMLGIDELKLDRGMRGIFTDLGARRPIDLIDGIKKWQVARWLSQLDDRQRIAIVAIDMTPAYRDVVNAILPKAVVVIDKFHVQRCANQALDQVRNRARRMATGAGRRNPWRGQRLLRMRAHRLSEGQAFEVDGITANNPLVNAAWTAKEAFFGIWEATSRGDAERLFAEWAASLPAEIEPEFGKVAKMIERWRVEVFPYFDYATSNAYTENRNGLIKMANRAGRGYGFPAIRAKALLAKPLGSMQRCPSCNGEFPTSSFRSDTFGHEVCGGCHYRFHTGEGQTSDVDNLRSSTH